ncbi:hypothetical protein [Photobacterium aphoticum]|uniref:hypothetical protein n=1 Tax=Photobacterium aphoticum TaxID=754436 RepID=UPI0011B20EB4|nr:hypothetical protein [Photobacterium aphoticum]
MTASIQWYSNASAVVNKPLPFTPQTNFYRAVAQCVKFAGNEPTYIRSVMAIIPVDGDRRLVVMTNIPKQVTKAPQAGAAVSSNSGSL